MTFSSDEIESGVSNIVQGAPTYGRDGLGGRNVKERFEQTRELVNSVMLYEPDSVYYLIYKAVIKARSLLRSTLSIMDDLSSDLDGMAVPAKAVNDTSALSDASTALGVISGALARRGSISGAEYQRYEKAVDRALNVYKDSVKRTYTPFSGSSAITDVVRSSAESVADLQTNFNTFKTSYETLLGSVDTLLGGFDDYDHSVVISSVASRQMSRIQSEMATLDTNFQATSPEQRTKTARADTLSLITNKASVKALARTRAPGEPKLQQTTTGTTTYRMSANGTGSPAAMTGDACGPWPILDSSILEFDFGGTLVSVPLVSGSDAVPGVKAATLLGQSSTFNINEDLDTPWPLLTKEITASGTYATTDTWFYLVVDGVMYRVTDDTSGPPYSAFSGDRTATQLAGDINFHVPTVTATAMSGGGNDWVSIEYNNSSPPDMYANRYMQVATGPLYASDLGAWRVNVDGTPTAGELSSGWDGNDELWVWPNSFMDSAIMQMDLPNGSWPEYSVAAPQIMNAINASLPEDYVIASVEGGKIRLTSGDGSGDELKGEGSILKIQTEGLDLSDKKTPSMLGVETLGFYNDQEIRESDIRSSVIVGVLNASSDFAEKATAELVETVLFSSKGGERSAPARVRVLSTTEPDGWSSWPTSGAKLSIESGENRGVYNVVGLSTGMSGDEYEAEFILDRTLRDQAATSMRVKFYTEFLKITAKDAGTGDYIEVDTTDSNSAYDILGLPTSTVRGTVTQILVEYNDPVKGWIAANLKGLGIKVGDIIKLSDETLVTTVAGISSIGDGIIDVVDIDPTLSLSEFTIESVASKDHASFLNLLQDWKDGLSDEELNLTDLEKSVNILLKLKNPVRGRVEVAANELQAIRNILEGSSSALSEILVSFQQAQIPAVDRALDVMTENGQDRARDLITSAKFSEFNATNYKTASTAGAMMDAASKVAISDLVEPTKTREEYVSEISRHRATIWDDVDPKYNFGDVRADSAPVHLNYFAVDIPKR